MQRMPCASRDSECVAGVQTPAFVERCASTSGLCISVEPLVSPEFRLRPSLSGAEAARGPNRGSARGVAGVQTPAFVERSQGRPRGAGSRGACVAGVQTPAFVERRPPLTMYGSAEFLVGVAGVQTPAFVERS